MVLEIRPVDSEQSAEIWRDIHNTIIPASPLSPEDVQDRRRRNHLTLAYVDGLLVGNATIRPASADRPATVIVRILSEHRRRGYGSTYLDRLITENPILLEGDLSTVVLLANRGALPFAERHGFTEVDRYVVDGAEYADLLRRA